MSESKLGHIYQNYLDERVIYYISEWDSGEILVEEFKLVESKHYPYVYEDEDYIIELDMFESMISNGHVRDLGLIGAESGFDFQKVYNNIDNHWFGNNTNMVLVRDRTKNLYDEISKLDKIDIDSFLNLARKYRELI